MKLKLIILTLSVVLAIAANSQVTLGIGMGASARGKFVAGFNAGYSSKIINVSGALQTHTSNQVSTGAAIQIRIGHEFKINEDYSIEPYSGYVYNLHTIDVKGANSQRILLGLQVSKYLVFRGDDVKLYLSGTHTWDHTFITFGIQGLFGGNR